MKARLVTSFAVGILARLTDLVGYSILILIIVFQETTYVPCEQYFEQLPKTEAKTIDIISERDTGSLIIADNDDARQVEIYVPEPNVVESKTDKVKTYTRTYTRSRKKAREVKFSDFRKNDPVLSKLDEVYRDIEIDEPVIPER